jgi:hypothetical protein
LDEDHFACCAGGQKLMPFPAVPKHLRIKVPAFHTLDCDGVTGFKVKTINGRVGAFVIWQEEFGVGLYSCTRPKTKCQN